MKFYNLKNHNEQVSCFQAIANGLGTNQGLFFPTRLPKFKKNEINEILEMDFIDRSSTILSQYFGDEISYIKLHKKLKKSFFFPVKTKLITNNISCIELFHGPTLSFKDFGSQFMSQILPDTIVTNKKIIILTATSGDTGAAVANAFYNKENIRVIILYPKGKITSSQEKLFCTLGNNIETISVNDNFDGCQALVKLAFHDKDINTQVCLNSANSINISRLLSQICYYFEAISQIPIYKRDQIVLSVPSGNFGNLTSGLLAKSLGLPIKKFIIATNINDTVPRFIQTGKWMPHPTLSTISNAMDVSQPNNWPRVEEILRRKGWKLNDLLCGSICDMKTKASIQELYSLGYISDPHSAVAYHVLKNHLKKTEHGIFLCTAHPAKFISIVESIVKVKIIEPNQIKLCSNLPILSSSMKSKFSDLKNYLLT